MFHYKYVCLSYVSSLSHVDSNYIVVESHEFPFGNEVNLVKIFSLASRVLISINFWSVHGGMLTYCSLMKLFKYFAMKAGRYNQLGYIATLDFFPMKSSPDIPSIQRSLNTTNSFIMYFSDGCRCDTHRRYRSYKLDCKVNCWRTIF